MIPVGLLLRRNEPVVAVPDVSKRIQDSDLLNRICDSRVRVLKSPRSAQLWGEFGMLLNAGGFPQQAEVCYKQAIALNPKSSRWSYLSGISCEPRDPDAAAGHYRAALESDDDPAIHLRLAELLLKQQQLDEAEKHVEAATQLTRANPRAWFVRAQCLFRKGQFDESLSWARRAAIAAPDQRAPQLLLLRLLHRQDAADSEELRTVELRSERAALTAWPDPAVKSVLALRQRGQSASRQAEELFSKGKVNEAIAALHRARAQEPHLPDHAVQLTGLYLHVGDLQRAAAIADEAWTQWPAVVEVGMMRARIDYQRRDWDAAARVYQQIIDRNPDFAIAHFNLGQCLDRLGQSQAALEAFRAAAVLDPGFEQAHTRIRAMSATDDNR